MSWADFYLICFVLGFLLSVLSLLGSLHVHLPHLHIHLGGHAHAPQAGSVNTGDLAPINFATISAFLAWFGGTGYLLARYSSFWFLIGFGIAAASGVIGAAIVFFFLAKVLIRRDDALNPADYEMVGVLGTVSSHIRSSGTGEIIFAQAGVRRASPARSDDGIAAISKGAEVIVTCYERGIAYVRPWEELTHSSATTTVNKEG